MFMGLQERPVLTLKAWNIARPAMPTMVGRTVVEHTRTRVATLAQPWCKRYSLPKWMQISQLQQGQHSMCLRSAVMKSILRVIHGSERKIDSQYSLFFDPLSKEEIDLIKRSHTPWSEVPCCLELDQVDRKFSIILWVGKSQVKKGARIVANKTGEEVS